MLHFLALSSIQVTSPMALVSTLKLQQLCKHSLTIKSTADGDNADLVKDIVLLKRF